MNRRLSIGVPRDRYRMLWRSWLAAVSLFVLSATLDMAGLLNHRDLGFVGGDSGSIWEYATNSWYWSAVTGALLALAVVWTVGEGLVKAWPLVRPIMAAIRRESDARPPRPSEKGECQ